MKTAFLDAVMQELEDKEVCMLRNIRAAWGLDALTPEEEDQQRIDFRKAVRGE